MVYLALSALNAILGILNAVAKLFDLLARERDWDVVCCHILASVGRTVCCFAEQLRMTE